MMRLLTRVFLLLLLCSILHAQERLLFKPLIANPFEPRIGTMYQFGDNKLRLDIGHSFDLMQLDSDAVHEVRLGGDFFTFTRLRSEGKLKFPVETVDYFFGINGSAAWKNGNTHHYLRARLAHISAHLTDGLANDSARLNPRPFVYSREFLDITGAAVWRHIRFYVGCNFIFSNHKLNESVNRIIPQVGFEYSKPLIGAATWFIAYDGKVSGVGDSTSFIHAVQAGISIPQFNNYQLIISAYYYRGQSMHGLFYDTTDDYFGVGFQVGL